MDCTFDQDRFTSLLPQLDLRNNSFHSIDLSAATDRMPIALQQRLVEHVYGSSEKSKAWKRVLVDLPFTSRENVSVEYGAGQPMGAYSSWPVMALTHHIMVQVAALRARASGSSTAPFTSYALLGDDLVIANDNVAREYKKLLATLCMPFSIEKTHVSATTFEFAKRWFHKGQEVTGFSLSGLMSVWKSYPLLLNFLQNQSKHGWVLPLERHPDLILALHKEIHGDKFIYNRTASMIKLYNVFNWILTLKGKSKTGYPGLLKSLSENFGLDLLEHVSVMNSPVDIIELIYTESKKYLVEKDLYTFQKDAYVVNARLNKFVQKRIEGTCADQATREFLKETLSVVLNWNHPMVMCLNRMIDRSTEFLMNYWDPDISSDFLWESGLSKYHVSKGVFSARAQVSMSLAESAVLKAFLTITKDVCEGRSVPTLNSQGFWVLEKKT